MTLVSRERVARQQVFSFFVAAIVKMSGYQIANNIPTYFIPNGQQELGQTQVNFLLDRMNKPTESTISPILYPFFYTLTCEQVLNGFVSISPIGGAGTIRFPIGSELFDCLQERVYAQQGITVNPNPSTTVGTLLANPNRSLVRQEFLQLQDGFSIRFALYNNCGGNLTLTPTVADTTLIPSATGGGLNVMPTNKVNNMVFTVIDAANKIMAVTFESSNNFA